MRIRSFANTLLLPLLILISACTSEPETIHETRFMMGTLVDFTVYGANKESASIAIKAAADEMQQVEDIFTIYGNQPNRVKVFNASPPDSLITFPDEINSLLNISIEVEEKSMGAFSPTLGALNKRWGFSLPTPPETPPSMEEIETLKAGSTDCLLIQLDGWSRTNGDCMLDFGAIAKGYALDQGMRQLQLHGISNAIINAGGDIRVSGSHGKREWQVGIRHPRIADKIVATIGIKGNISIVTSGDYERFYIHQGNRYHHILNPDTGMPAMKSQSATVIAADATTADAWSTALFVMGRDGLKTIEEMGMDAILIDAEGSVYSTKNIESRLQLSSAPPMLRSSD
jgi:thiamine biosynthesis lipoprotein